MADVLITVTRSAGTDGAIVVFVDNITGKTPVRVILNDADEVGESFTYDGMDRDARSVSFSVDLADVDYTRDYTLNRPTY